MSKPMSMKRVFAWASLCSFVIAPAVLTIGQAVAGSVHIVEVWAGAFVAGAFFATTNITLLLFQDSSELKHALIASYVAKTLILMAVFFGFGEISMDRTSFGFSVAFSGVIYVVVQGILGSRKTIL